MNRHTAQNCSKQAGQISKRLLEFLFVRNDSSSGLLTFLRTYQSQSMLNIFSLHPCKRNDSGATNAISNLSLSMMSVLTNELSEVFHIQSPITSEEICDKIQTQRMRFQREPLQDEWFKNPLDQINSSTSDCRTTRQSYWPQVLNDCGLQPACKHSTSCKLVDNIWYKIGSLTHEHGNHKYPKLHALVQAICPLALEMLIPSKDFRSISSFCKAMGT